MNQEELKAFYKAQKDQMIANKVNKTCSLFAKLNLIHLHNIYFKNVPYNTTNYLGTYGDKINF